MKSKTKKKNKNKRKAKVQGNKFSLWLEKHRVVEAFLNFLVLIVVAIGVGYLTFGNESIPAPLREFSYISPLYLNLFLLITFPFNSWFGSLRGEGSNSLKDISEVFLYLNGLLFLLHYFIGIELEDGEGFLPPLWNLNPRYVWFPIATYLIFFFIPALTMLILKYNEKRGKNMTKENLSKLFSFITLYLALLTFVILHLILLPFGLSFTPVLWNSWFFILCLTFFIHPWIVFFRTRDFHWYHLIFQLFSGLVALYLWFSAFFALSIVSDPAMPINIDYHIQDKEIIIVRGFVVHSTYEHHELINPFVMKSEVKYNEDMF